MPFEIPFATMLEFASRGTNEKAQLSKRICGNIKSGNSIVIERLIHYMSELPEDHPISQMFDDNPILVPAPRSTPMVEGALWPTRILSEHFVNSGFGGGVQNLIARITPVPKSSNYFTAESRPSCNTHYNSLLCTPPQAFIEKIILIDDVFTLGRTSCACARKLREIYPNAEIFVFAAMRTRGFVKSLEEIVRPSYNQMVYHPENDNIKLPD
ncbi:hypothetical protein [Flagellimonas oceanensis]|uniref:phosphoribosyltransferase n=1 Tax=Flagellimonas oceanensis TaxID=2499163 RepID=UPI000C902A57|nr:hypothetical protein [Allomuricauda sp.]